MACESQLVLSGFVELDYTCIALLVFFSLVNRVASLVFFSFLSAAVRYISLPRTTHL